MSDAVLISIIVGFFGTLSAAISAYALTVTRETHKLINSRMDELLALTRAAGVAAGVEQELARDKTDDPA